jgi:MFS family permease
LRLLPWTATLFVFAPIAGALVNRVGERPLIVIGLFLQAIGIAWIGLIIAPDLAYSKLITPLVLAGAGVSMAMPAAQNAVLSAVAPAEIGKASGAFNMFRFLAGAFGIAILVAVFAQAGRRSAPASLKPSASLPRYRCWPQSPACGSPRGARWCWRRSVRNRETHSAA